MPSCVRFFQAKFGVLAVVIAAMLASTSLLGETQAAAANVPAPGEDIVLHGVITAEKLGKHEMLPFTVPAGIERMTVELISPGFQKGMYLTAGLFDPQRYRGEGRSVFTVSTVDATGPYLPGPIVPGTWRLAIGYNFVAANAKGEFTVKIHLSKQLDLEHYKVIRSKAGWYKGDLHSHTGLTDAMCKSQSGADVPCPPSKLFEAAAKQKLDFLAVTDHNTAATFNEIMQAQLYYDQMLLIGGEEITTVKGHANVWGTEGFLDYRVAESGFTANDLFDQAHKLHALVSINHSYWPYDGRCPGCGWGWEQTDFSKLDAIEIINGYHEHGSWFTPPPGNGVPFWEQQLARGLRPTGVGGGDEHRAGEQLALHDGVGIPTTVVYARELSQPAILEGIKAGHVFVQVTGPDGTPLYLSAGSAIMGDAIVAEAGKRVWFKMTTQEFGQAKLRLLVDGIAVNDLPAVQQSTAAEVNCLYDWLSDGKRHWVRAELDSADGDPITLTNPIYVNWGQ
ncbi:CehA/McbA family metallohydrolase [Granulicella sp. dw_53]|uniref:CehA/McbA family metallohydrolase n=1 Tax=Granulicella sp. dw_53 TaxID=2719792 RepID=UPI001BD2A008|nr:CehA/McbA family metallohydrolase [Granulicella sp. dw_53]